MNGQFRFIAICAGGGVGCHGLSSAGWCPAGFIEIEQDRRELLAKHYPGCWQHDDLCTVEARQLPDSELWFVTLPCQSFSIAARDRKGLLDPRGELWFAFIDLVSSARKVGKLPKFILYENVRGVLSCNRGQDWKTIQDSARATGLVAIAADVLDAREFGVPQSRERLIALWRVGNE